MKIATLMYAEFKLKKRVDWTSIHALDPFQKNLGKLGVGYDDRIITSIPSLPLPTWFLQTTSLTYDPTKPMPAFKKPADYESKNNVQSSPALSMMHIDFFPGCRTSVLHEKYTFH